MLIEHIAIAKSFGRINNYTINPSQEMVAIGVTNMLGPFLGGYAATGSFSRTAVKSKAGVRTPFAGVITGCVVLLAIYALPAVFYYIPNATLAAVIIHAVGDLITPPNTIYQFWLVSPLEVLIFFVGVFVTIFSSIENGIYCTVRISFAVLLFRILKAKGRFLGRVKVHSVLGDHVIGDDPRKPADEGYGTFAGSGTSLDAPYRNIFLPITHADGSNPEIELENPYPGVFIYRLSEGFNYPNASHTLEYMVQYIYDNTRRTTLSHFDRPGDRPWNDPGPSRRKLKAAARNGVDTSAVGVNMHLPTLKAIILDFSAVNNVDITSIQQLIDTRNQLDRYASPDAVDWHIACIGNRWTKRALVSAGFGYPSPLPDGQIRRWKSIFSVAEIGGEQSAAATAEQEVNEKEFGPTLSARSRAQQQQRGGNSMDIESGSSTDDTENIDTLKASASGSERVPGAVAARPRFGSNGSGGRTDAVHGINRPLFHVDLTSALQSAIANVEARAEFTASTSSSIKGVKPVATPMTTSPTTPKAQSVEDLGEGQERAEGGGSGSGSGSSSAVPRTLPPYELVDPRKDGEASS